MRLLIRRDGAAVSAEAARIVQDAMASLDYPVLGLSTGRTVTGLYQELSRSHAAGELDFSRVTTFNLDEYVDLGPDHPSSFARFMHVELFSKINLDPSRINVPDGLAPDLEAHCLDYEALIQSSGGIDLQILGIGTDGHIAFNEPGSSLGSRTRLKALTDETRRQNASSFGREEKVPRVAITMGVGTILEARSCLLLAIGRDKAAAIRDSIEGPVTSQITASALQLHPNVTVVIDEDAAHLLRRRSYYAQVEEAELEMANRSTPAER